MTTALIMIFIVIAMAVIFIVGCRKNDEKSFFDLENTGVLRGVFSIIIMLVHVPEAYKNPIQDMIGSFAYVGVTFFFMTSAYGLMVSVTNKPDSIRHFWSKRLVKLFLPMILVNALFFTYTLVVLKEFKPLLLLSVHNWIKQLLVFYLAFYLVFRFVKCKIDTKVFVLCGFVAVFSLFIYFFNEYLPFGWYTEALGFGYGILLAFYKDRVREFLLKKWFVKIAVITFSALIFGVLYLKYKSIGFVGEYLIKIVLCFAILVLLLGLNSRFSLGNTLSRYLGSISYEIYLTHAVVFEIIMTHFESMDSGIYILCSLIATILVSMLISFVGNQVLSKPMRKPT